MCGVAAARDGHPSRRRGGTRVSASTQRRDEAARADRRRAGVRATAADSRRTDHGARCDGGGADPAPAGTAAATEARQPAVHQPQPGRGSAALRPRRRDVRQPVRRTRQRARRARAAGASLQQRAAGLAPAAARRIARQPAAGDRRADADCTASRRWLCVRAALPVRRDTLFRRRAGAWRIGRSGDSAPISSSPRKRGASCRLGPRFRGDDNQSGWRDWRGGV